MEALTMKHCLAVVASLGFHDIIMESDSTEVVNVCTGSITWWTDGAAKCVECIDAIVEVGKVEFRHSL